jgi:hypothetical protein
MVGSMVVLLCATRLVVRRVPGGWQVKHPGRFGGVANCSASRYVVRGASFRLLVRPLRFCTEGSLPKEVP